DRVARYVEMLRCRPGAHAARAGKTNLQVKFHGVNPSSLLASIAKREKVDDFYAARSSTSPPLPWSNFAPPFSPAPEASSSARWANRSKASSSPLSAVSTNGTDLRL